MANNGGKRPGAGRKKGIPNKVTTAIREKIAASGRSPLEVMMKAMHAFEAAADKMKAGDILVVDKKVITHLSLLKSAAEVGSMAAPYVHPKLQTIEHTGKDGGPIENTVTLSAEESYLRMVKGR